MPYATMALTDGPRSIGVGSIDIIINKRPNMVNHMMTYSKSRSLPVKAGIVEQVLGYRHISTG